MSEQMELHNDQTLPYGTSWENILKLLEAIKKKQGDEKGIRAVFTGAKIDNTRKTMETLGLVSGFDFKQMGKELAYETNDEKRKQIFLKVILSYQPYELFLSRLDDKDFFEETELEEVKNFWGKHDFGVSPNNRNEAANVFGSFIQLSGLGEFITGRRGKPTRIQWNSEAKKLIDSILNDLSSPQEQIVEEIQPDYIPETKSDSPIVFTEQDEDLLINQAQPKLNKQNGCSLKVTPNITINIDMTDWDIDKMNAFFKAAYGEFDDAKDSEGV
ncbi:hypothetical protein M5E02_03355 [Bacillus safensis]|uniref:hypothetical protein n=1 Tax=Bacillus safensis TaxID=561879 RepID=UPI0020766540|nr:hypothetical protein [Bacillus safensis]USD83472.1 hypothetical protein M5E02_03355 [Bacillus safensis]